MVKDGQRKLLNGIKNILELGTSESTIALLSAAKELNGKVTSVDIDPCYKAKDMIKKLNLNLIGNLFKLMI